MDRTPTLAPSEMLCFALYSATLAMQAAYKPLLDPLGLTYPQYLAMAVLWAHESSLHDDRQIDVQNTVSKSDHGLTVGQIGTALHLESNTLTPLLKRLELANMITRSRTAQDERQVMICLSNSGRDLAKAAASIPACIIDRADLTPPSAEDLRARLGVLAQNLREPAP